MIAAKYYVFLSLTHLTTGLVVSAPTCPVFATKLPKPERFSIDEAIRDAALEHNVDPALIRSIIAAESSFEPDAESTSGAVGYMQINARNREELGYDATTNGKTSSPARSTSAFLSRNIKAAATVCNEPSQPTMPGPATLIATKEFRLSAKHENT